MLVRRVLRQERKDLGLALVNAERRECSFQLAVKNSSLVVVRRLELDATTLVSEPIQAPIIQKPVSPAPVVVAQFQSCQLL
jgi:hypothetical protein